MDHGDTFSLKGLSFRFELIDDTDHGAPWDECDGHGPVREYTGERGTKRPGERVMGTRCRVTWLYDFAAAVKIALRDGWGLSPDDLRALTTRLDRPPTRGDIAAAAAEADFMNLSRFVAVTLLDVDGNVTSVRESLWGIESNAGAYLDETARELAGEIARRIGRRKYLQPVPAPRVKVRE